MDAFRAQHMHSGAVSARGDLGIGAASSALAASASGSVTARPRATSTKKVKVVASRFMQGIKSAAASSASTLAHSTGHASNPSSRRGSVSNASPSHAAASAAFNGGLAATAQPSGAGSARMHLNELDDPSSDAAVFANFRAAGSGLDFGANGVASSARSLVTPNKPAAAATAAAIAGTSRPSTARRAAATPESLTAAGPSSGVGTFRRNPFLTSSAAKEPPPRAAQALDDVRTKSNSLRAQLGAEARARAEPPKPREVWSAQPVAPVEAAVAGTPAASQPQTAYHLPDNWRQWPVEEVRSGTPGRAPRPGDAAAADSADPFVVADAAAASLTASAAEYAASHSLQFSIVSPASCTTAFVPSASKARPYAVHSHPLPTPGQPSPLGPPLEVDYDAFIPMEALSARAAHKLDQSIGHAVAAPPSAPQGAEYVRLPREKQEELFRTYQTLLLQWCFVNARTQAAFESQQVRALGDIAAVSAELQRVRGDLAIKLLQRARREHFTKLDRVLDEQSRVHATLAPHLRAFEAQYTQLARAVQFARHRVGLDEVDVSAAAVGPALAVSARQLARATELLAPHLPTLAALETAAASLQRTLASEVEELDQLQALVQRAATLEADERALRIEDMQRGRVDDMKRLLLTVPTF